ERTSPGPSLSLHPRARAAEDLALRCAHLARPLSRGVLAEAAARPGAETLLTAAAHLELDGLEGLPVVNPDVVEVLPEADGRRDGGEAVELRRRRLEMIASPLERTVDDTRADPDLDES